LTPPRFRFGPFVLSPAHRVLLRDGVDLPLIPRYFDLLMLLVAHRNRAVTRHEIFDLVWKDIVVSDGALSQAVRTIRRALGDDPREPQFIRTVARHGYQFVRTDVIEEDDDRPLETKVRAASPDEATSVSIPAADSYAGLIDCLLRRGAFKNARDDERWDAAEQLHALGTSEALRRIDDLSGHEEARAILRDARWSVAGAGDVPLVRSHGAAGAIGGVIALRLRRAAWAVASRWVSASLGGAAAGVLAGSIGGLALWLVPQSHATSGAIPALALVGAAAGALGAAGVGAGLVLAEALSRSHRTLALVVFGALSGGLTGAFAQALARALISSLFGRDAPIMTGASEGLLLGFAAGLGYAVSTSTRPGGGMATPRGRARLRTALATGFACAAAATLLAWMNRHLVASSLDAMAEVFNGSAVGLAPIARLLGEEQLRPVTRTLASAFEGLVFGAGVAFGLTHRPDRG
jgi:DNA-binding winged helix-turn-helix (wHTH) protein